MVDREHIVTIPNDDRIGMLEIGEPSGRPVFYMHGFPSSRLEAELIDEQARQAGARVVALDRPGIGKSDQSKDFRLLDWPAIVSDVADQLSIARFGVMGFSAGAPFALACAAALQDRVTGCALVSAVPPAPILAAASRGFARFAWRYMRSVPSFALRMFLGVSLHRIAAASAERIDSLLGDNSARLGAADSAAFQQDRVRWAFASAVAESYTQGPRANQDQAIMLTRPWGFDLNAIGLPVSIFHGRDDHIMPAATAEMLAGQLPAGKLHLLPHEGHVSALLAATPVALASIDAP